MADYTFRYVVQMHLAHGTMTPAGWATRARAGATLPKELRGVPTAAKLARYVADYNASLLPGGVNAHLGLTATALSATIFDRNNGNRPIASYPAPARRAYETLDYVAD